MEEKAFRELLERAAKGKATKLEHDKLNRLIREVHLSNSQLHDVENNRQEVTDNILSHIKKQKRFRITRELVKYAAAILVLVTGYYAFLFFKATDQTPMEATARINLVEHYSEYGQQSKLTLSDGSILKLNAGTKLFYPEKFTGDQRMIKLEGQAFFDVASDTTKPFVIDAGDMRVTVLGTSFDVNAFADNNISNVTVLTGKVKVELKGEKEPIMLTTNKQLNYDVITNEYSINTADAKESIAWVNGILRFDESYLEDVFRQMQRWYNIKIIVKEGIDANCTVSGRHKNQGFNIVLEGLQYTHGLEYQLSNDTVLITKINCE